MKKYFSSVLIVLITVLSLASSAFAANDSSFQTPGNPAGFESSKSEFSGYVYGDNGSKASIQLEFSQTGEHIVGEVDLGEGLYINGGICGASYVPAITQELSVETVPYHPNQLSTRLVFDISNIEVSVDLNAELVDDGNAINAEAKIDLPWFCGRDPVIRGKLYRI